MKKYRITFYQDCESKEKEQKTFNGYSLSDAQNTLYLVYPNAIPVSIKAI